MQKDKPAIHRRFHDHPSPCTTNFFKSDGYDYSSPYPSVLLPRQNLNSPASFSPYTPSPRDFSPGPCDYSPGPRDYSHPSPYLFPVQKEDLKEQQSWCLSRLRETTKEAEALRQENFNLQIANNELNKQFNNLIMLQSSSNLQKSRVAPAHEYISMAPPTDAFSIDSLVDSFSGLHVAKKPVALSEESDDSENLDVNRVLLPKSISVRSNGYLKKVQDAGSSSRGGGSVPVPNRTKAVKTAQRVYIGGGRKEETPLELQVYNQGVTKTELCNKWQQTGTCPYGKNCQFAHGIEELHPVLRHPRYKTEVCFMVLNGEPCPYGHRCHFRHSLTDQERLMAQQLKNLRSV